MKEFSWPVRVYYEDTDLGGVVYYANYLKFMERARTEWLRQRGLHQEALRSELRLIFVVRSLQMDFAKPARLDDLLSVTADISHAGKASLTFDQRIFRENDAKELCAAKVKIACIDAETFRPSAMPSDVLRILKDV